MAGPGGAAPAGDINIQYGPSGFKGLAREPYIFFLACFASIGGVLFGYIETLHIFMAGRVTNFSKDTTRGL